MAVATEFVAVHGYSFELAAEGPFFEDPANAAHARRLVEIASTMLRAMAPDQVAHANQGDVGHRHRTLEARGTLGRLAADARQRFVKEARKADPAFEFDDYDPESRVVIRPA